MRVRGFTMIEILVVMVIIGVLATLGGTTYVKSLSRGRDARRLEDMKSIQKGFELYYAKHDDYLIDSSTNSCDGMYADTTIFSKGKEPSPPRAGDYTVTCDYGDDTYCACALMENGGDYGNSTDADCTFSDTNPTHFCVQNIQ